MSLKNQLKTLFVSLSVIILFSACGDDSNPFRTDYSDVPELPDTTGAITTMVNNDGVTIYVMDEGDPESLGVTIRDDVYIYYSTRIATDMTIIQSSYANGSSQPTRVNDIGAQASINYVGDNLFRAMQGMKEGGRRVLVFPDSVNTSSSDLILDIELEQIVF
jgi:hypothetical protein